MSQMVNNLLTGFSGIFFLKPSRLPDEAVIRKHRVHRSVREAWDLDFANIGNDMQNVLSELEEAHNGKTAVQN